MIKYLKVLAIMAIALFSVNAMAWTPPASPKPSGNIVDLAHVLTRTQVQNLNVQLHQINTNSANEIGVLILPSLDGENIRDVGFATAKAWGVGKQGLDNGVMVIWSPGDRKIGIETGSGVEGDLPDLQCNDIIRNVIAPQFRQKNYASGLSQAFIAITTTIGDHRAALAQRDQENTVRSNGDNSATTATPVVAPRSGGCDISGAIMSQAGFSAGIIWLLVMGLVWFLIRRHQASVRRRYAREDLENEEYHRQELDRLTTTQNTLQQEQQVKSAVPTVAAVAVVASTTAIADYILRQQELAEDRRQAHLQRLVEERYGQEMEKKYEDGVWREREEDATFASAVVASEVFSDTSSDSSDDTSNGSDSSSDSGSSCSSGSDDSSSGGDFGGGDFGGGGSSDSY